MIDSSGCSVWIHLTGLGKTGQVAQGGLDISSNQPSSLLLVQLDPFNRSASMSFSRAGGCVLGGGHPILHVAWEVALLSRIAGCGFGATCLFFGRVLLTVAFKVVLSFVMV